MIIIFKKVQNQTDNEAIMNQRVNGHSEEEEETYDLWPVTYDLAAARLVRKWRIFHVKTQKFYHFNTQSFLKWARYWTFVTQLVNIFPKSCSKIKELSHPNLRDISIKTLYLFLHIQLPCDPQKNVQTKSLVYRSWGTVEIVWSLFSQCLTKTLAD